MKEIQLSTGTYLIVENPPKQRFVVEVGMLIDIGNKAIELPNGFWEVVGTSEWIQGSEVVAKKVIERHPGFPKLFKNYTPGFTNEVSYFAVTSFRSLKEANKVPNNAIWLKKTE